MITHALTQGTPEWLAYRASHFNASDAPAMMGCSPYKTRSELLREMHTGVPADVSATTQRIFDDGHRFEAMARPLAEALIGEDLFPVVGSEGRLSASFDGLTLAGDLVFEHKTACAELRAVMLDEHCGPSLPLHYRVQMEQQLHVSGASRALFMATLWDGDVCTFSRHCWYEPDDELRAAILRGWDQFAADLAAYKLPPAAEAAPVGHAPETLPALRIEVTGQVTASNLAEFKQTALAAIRSVNRDLRTDQDFADAEKAVKWCADVESRISAAKAHALSQTASIDALFRALEDITAEAKRVRLDLDKLVTRRKTEVKEEAIVKARSALDAHIATLNAEVAPMRLPPVPADFAGAIKNKRSIASMQDALDTTLAGAKIAAEGAARLIRTNAAVFRESAEGLEFLFSDLGQIISKPADDFALLVRSRVDHHRAAEAERERKRLEAEQARIAAEAQRLAAEQVRRAQEAESQRRAAEAAAAAALQAMASAPVAQPLPVAAPAPRPEPAIVAAPPLTAGPADLLLGAICARLGFTVSAAFLADLGFQPARTDKTARFFTESQFRQICAALQAHIGRVARVDSIKAAAAADA